MMVMMTTMMMTMLDTKITLHKNPRSREAIRGGARQNILTPTEPNRTEPNRTEPNRAEPNQTEPNRTKPNRTEPNCTNPTEKKHYRPLPENTTTITKRLLLCGIFRRFIFTFQESTRPTNEHGLGISFPTSPDDSADCVTNSRSLTRESQTLNRTCRVRRESRHR